MYCFPVLLILEAFSGVKMTKESKKPLVLAVDTSGRTGSAAVGFGEKIVAETIFSGQIRHSAELFPSIGKLFAIAGRKACDVDHVYICAGPGSFTGLRIAVTMAKMMAFGCGAAIVAVDTRDALAGNVEELTEKGQIRRIGTIIDAKRGQFYVGVFEGLGGKWQKTTDNCLMTATEFIEEFAGKGEPLWLLGEGLVYYRGKFEADGVRIIDEKYWQVQPGVLYRLGRKIAGQGGFVPAKELVPLYLRRPEAEANWQKQGR